MIDKSSLSSTWSWWFVVITAFLSALAYGAVWTLLSNFLARDLPWLGLLAAVGMVWSVRSCIHRSVPGALLAAIGTALAAYYSECLSALTRLSSELGMSLLEVLQHTSLGAAMNLGRISIHSNDIAWYLTSAALAFVLSMSLPRTMVGNPIPP